MRRFTLLATLPVALAATVLLVGCKDSGKTAPDPERGDPVRLHGGGAESARRPAVSKLRITDDAAGMALSMSSRPDGATGNSQG